MIYSLDLKTALLITGLFLVICHGIALGLKGPVKVWLKGLPRSKAMGFLFLGVASAWSWLLIANIDLGEFSNWRTRILVLIPIAFVLTLRFVNEFLAVRALGMVALLAAEPLLESAWMRPEAGRLFLVSLAYCWIIFGLFWIGIPYVLRDQIGWVTKTETRWNTVALAGLAYGALLVSVGVFLK